MDDSIGKLIRQPSMADTLSPEAISALLVKLNKVRLSGIKLTVRQAIREYVSHKGASGTVSSQQFSHLGRIERDLGKLKVVNLTHDLLNAWVTKLLETGKHGQPYARDTVHTMVSYLGVVLRLAQSTHHIPDLPRLPKVGNLTVRQRFTTGEDFAAALECVCSPVIRDLLEFLFHYGWRRSEPLSLTWEQVNFEHGVVVLTKSKTGRGRAVPMTPGVRALLQCRLTQKKEGCSLVFHENGLPINRDRVTRVLKAACVAAKVKVITTHDLRRTAARDLIASGADASAAKAITGHQTLGMFDRYNIQDLRTAQVTVERLATFRGLGQRSIPTETQTPTGSPKSAEEHGTSPIDLRQYPTVSILRPKQTPKHSKAMLVQAHRALLEMGLGQDWHAWG